MVFESVLSEITDIKLNSFFNRYFSKINYSLMTCSTNELSFFVVVVVVMVNGCHLLLQR